MSTETATIGEVFSLAWQQYKQRALPILAVLLISSAIVGGLVMIMVLCGMFGGAILTHFIDERTALLFVIIVVVLLLLVVTVLAVWCQAALLAIIVDDELGIIEAFRTGWDFLWPMAWIMTIWGGIMITGFLCAILPGILFMVWFSFCFYTMIAEDRRGLDSLLASMEYVRGHWWDTFVKLLLVWLLSVLLSVIPFVGQILSILFAPYFMLFMLIMYRDLKEIKGEVVITAGSGTRIFWWVLAVIGLLLPILGLAGALVTLLSGDQTWLEYSHQSVKQTWL